MASPEQQPSAKRMRASELGLLPLSSGAVAAAEAALPPLAAMDQPLPRSPSPALEEKPDMFDFFAQRASKQRELEMEVARLAQREAQLTAQLDEAELAAAQARDGARSAAARAAAREAQLELQLREQQDALRLEVERAAGLSAQLRSARAAAEAAEQRAAAAAADAEAAAAPTPGADGPSAAAELRLQVTQLQLQLEQLASDKEEGERRAEVALATARQRYEAEAAASALLQRQLDEAAAAAEHASADRHALESALAERERRIVQLEAQLEGARSGGGDGVLVKALRDQLRDQEALVAEARRLKEQAHNVHVIREQLERAEARARQAEELLPDAAGLQGRLAAAEQQLGRWRVILDGAADCACPEDVLHLLTSLQKQQMEAAVQVGDKAEEVAQARSDAAAADAARAEAEQAAAAAQAAADQAAAALSRAERKLVLLTKERDGLKGILASYDEEYLNQQGAELGPQQKRIVELEAQAAALHAHVASLEEELGSRGAAAAGATAGAGEAVARAEAAEARARALEGEAENLGKQLALLQERLGRGEYNAATTRVLHFKYNPEAELAREARDARVAELESENEALRENLGRLEAAAAQGKTNEAAAGSMRVAQLEGETNLLRRRVAELQKGMERLQQVFNKQITLFREAVYILFGYRVEMATDPAAREFKAQFVLRPQHAEDGAAQLVFRMLRDNRMVLVPTDLSARLQREVETFIDRFRSIPAFTANLTMDCFQKQTQC
ncbi:hypothetical protein ABPG77_004623 [Micractinium sp. CCAP 211/92]